MTYTIEDVKRLVPEAGEVYQGPDYIEVVVNGFTFTVRHPMIKALLDTRRKLEVARLALDRIMEIPNALSSAQQIALTTIKKLDHP